MRLKKTIPEENPKKISRLKLQSSAVLLTKIDFTSSSLHVKSKFARLTKTEQSIVAGTFM